jgi:tRNA-dihydrouridine synthase
MLEETKCDYAMIGRWTRGNPWCFNQVQEYLKTKKYEEIKT